MMTTEWTAIRRRLAVRGAANRPPWGRRKVGHGSIVAPLAGAVAATVAVGVGVALARAERNRRSARARGGRDRQFALWPGERLADGLRRMALEQLDLAIELLEGSGGRLPYATAVHETRKSLKRLRTLMRLLEEELGETAFAREDAVLREAGLRLAGARDAEVMVSTLDGLLEHEPGKLAGRRGVVKLRLRLAAERDWAARRALGDAAARVQVLGDLRAVRGRVAEWRLPDCDGIGTIAPGLRRLYRQGRRRYRLAARRRGDQARAMHDWRKRAKDLRYALEMLDRRDGTDRNARGKRAKRRRKRADRWGRPRARGGKQRAGRRDVGRIRQLAREADELAEILGQEHDLTLLAARIRAGGRPVAGEQPPATGPHGRQPAAGGGGGRTREKLLRLIERRRRSLRRQALRKGKRLYRRRPRKFVRRVGVAYARRSAT